MEEKMELIDGDIKFLKTQVILNPKIEIKDQ